MTEHLQINRNKAERIVLYILRFVGWSIETAPPLLVDEALKYIEMAVHEERIRSAEAARIKACELKIGRRNSESIAKAVVDERSCDDNKPNSR